MNDDSLDDTQPMHYCVRCDKEYPKAEAHNCAYVSTTMPNSVGKQESKFENCENNCYATEIWNAAIEEAAILIKGAPMFAEAVRSLKK